MTIRRNEAILELTILSNTATSLDKDISTESTIIDERFARKDIQSIELSAK